MNEELEKAIKRAFKNSQLMQRLESIERKIEQEKYKKFTLDRKKPFKTTMNPDFNNGSG